MSGLYLAHAVRSDGGGEAHIPFVVRDDDGASDLLFQTSDTTWQAYNRYGDYSLYQGPTGRAYKVSYDRPFTTRAYAGSSPPVGVDSGMCTPGHRRFVHIAQPTRSTGPTM